MSRPLLHLFAALLGALIPIVPLLIRNHLVLGGFWKTGYALTNEQTGFSVAYFKQHAIQYIQMIQGDGLGIVFALGLAGLACMCSLRRSRAMGVMLTLFVVPMLLLYMAYYWAPAGNAGATMRFLLPTFPIYLLAGVWLIDAATRFASIDARLTSIDPRVASREGRFASHVEGFASPRECSTPRAVFIVVPVVLVGFQLLWGTTDLMQRINRMSGAKQPLATITRDLLEIAQRDDVVISTSGFLQHADFVREWKLADLSFISTGGRGFGGGGGGGGGPGGGGRMFGGDADAPSPMQAEKMTRQRSLYTGTSAQKLTKFAADVTSWAGDGHKIYIVCPESDLRSTFGRDNAAITIVKKLTFPARREETGAGGGFGGGFGGGGPPGGGPNGMAGGPPGMGGGGPGGNRQRGGGGGGGGMFGLNFAGTTWIIAEWTPTLGTPKTASPDPSAAPPSETTTKPAEQMVTVDCPMRDEKDAVRTKVVRTAGDQLISRAYS